MSKLCSVSPLTVMKDAVKITKIDSFKLNDVCGIQIFLDSFRYLAETSMKTVRKIVSTSVTVWLRIYLVQFSYIAM